MLKRKKVIMFPNLSITQIAYQTIREGLTIYICDVNVTTHDVIIDDFYFTIDLVVQFHQFYWAF